VSTDTIKVYRLVLGPGELFQPTHVVMLQESAVFETFHQTNCLVNQLYITDSYF